MNLQLWAKLAIPVISIFVIILIIYTNILIFAEKKGADLFLSHQVEMQMDEFDHIAESFFIEATDVATILSVDNTVKQAYYRYKETGDIESSIEKLKQSIQEKERGLMKSRGSQIRIHYHLPPAQSFYRSWTDQRGDDLSGFRKSVLKVIQTGEAIKGIEVGRSGLVLRGIVPIFDDQGELLGSVESFFPIDSLIRRGQVRENEAFAVFVSTNQAKLTDNSFSMNINQNNASNSNLVLSNSTDENLDVDFMTPDFIDKALSSNYVEEENFIYSMRPLLDFEEKRIGYFVYRFDQSAILAARTNVNWMIAITFLFLLFLVVLGVTFLCRKIISEPILKVARTLSGNSAELNTKKFDINRNDEIGELFRATNSILNNFSELIDSVKGASLNLSTASEEILSISEQIAHSASQQALTAEEISASSENMLATFQSNLEEGTDVHKLSDGVAKHLKENNELFISSFNLLSDISKRITIISDLAYKSNILSLNASIEASKSNGHGKTFSVVAAEMGVLAKQSKDASEEIEQISLQGTNVSHNASEKLESVVPVILKVAQRIKAMMTTYQDQLQQAHMVDKAVSELTDIANRNSAAAEEMSANSEELASQAEGLKNLVRKL